MKRTLEVLNELERGGIIRRHALGGAIAARLAAILSRRGLQERYDEWTR